MKKRQSDGLKSPREMKGIKKKFVTYSAFMYQNLPYACGWVHEGEKMETDPVFQGEVS